MTWLLGLTLFAVTWYAADTRLELGRLRRGVKKLSYGWEQDANWLRSKMAPTDAERLNATILDRCAGQLEHVRLDR